MRTEQRAQARRLQQADSLNRVLRDELDGITQRAALLETSVERLADSRSPRRAGAAPG
jgi:uroporphyrin-3 C-methyltransferase